LLGAASSKQAYYNKHTPKERRDMVISSNKYGAAKIFCDFAVHASSAKVICRKVQLADVFMYVVHSDPNMAFLEVEREMDIPEWWRTFL